MAASSQSRIQKLHREFDNTQMFSRDHKSSSWNNLDNGELLSLLFLNDPSKCSFCGSNLQAYQGIMLQSCLHVFCSSCLRFAVESSSECQIPCPIGCGHFLYEREIKALVSPSVYNAYLKRGLEALPIFRCKGAACDSFCIVEEDTKSNIFLCPLCNRQNCLSCSAIHEGLSCDKYRVLRKEADRSPVKVTDEALTENATDNFGCKQVGKMMEELLDGIPKDNLALYYEAANQLMENMKIMPTTAEFECLICSRLNSETNNGGIILQTCLHSFCRDCLEEIVKNAEKTPVPCPYNDAGDAGPCKEYLTAAEFQALASPETIDKHIRWGWIMAADILPTFRCLTPNCLGFWEIDDTTENQVYSCPICLEANCIKCNSIHTDVSCHDYQEKLRLEFELQRDDENRIVQKQNEQVSEEELHRMLGEKVFMRCPFCQFICEKISGCSHVVCLNRACAKPFNWHN